MKSKLGNSILAGIVGLASAAILAGCAHAHDGSLTRHQIKNYGVVAPPGWTVVKPDVTNSASANAMDNITVIAPAGTNAPGFWTGLVQRPKTFLAYKETWEDTSAGGGTFVLTDPSASQLVFTRTNQAALGGSRSVSVGQLQSTITTNAVALVTAGGTAVGNVIGAAANTAAK